MRILAKMSQGHCAFNEEVIKRGAFIEKGKLERVAMLIFGEFPEIVG